MLAGDHGVPDDEVLLPPPASKFRILLEKLAYKHVRCLWVSDGLKFSRGGGGGKDEYAHTSAHTQLKGTVTEKPERLTDGQNLL